MDNPGPGAPARAQMDRTLALCDEVSRFLEQTCGTSAAEIDLVGVGLLTRAAHRELTPEARMCELQALVRRWVHESPPAALPGRAHHGARRGSAGR